MIFHYNTLNRLKSVERAKPNTWLLSNSTFYFASKLLEGDLPLNAYSIWDLCNLSEAILFAEKITTLPGLAEYNQAITKLRKKEIIEDLVEIRPDMDDLVLELKGSHIIRDGRINQQITDIMCNIFPFIDKDEVSSAISQAFDFGEEMYNSPDWGGPLTKSTMASDHIFHILKYDESFGISPILPCRKTLAEIYLRSILYLRIAAVRGLNYYPDPFRLPIVAFLNSIIIEVMNKYVPKLFQDSNSIRKKEIKSLNKSIGSSMYEVECPAALSMIIKRCDTKKDFLDKALEVREDKTLQGFRKWLAEASEAVLDHPQKFMHMKKQAQNILDKKEFDLKAVAESTTLGIELNGNANINLPIGKIISLTAEKFNNFFNPSRKSLIFFLNMTKNLDQIAARKNDFDRIFGRSLTSQELDAIAKLGINQRNYLNNIAKNKN